MHSQRQFTPGKKSGCAKIINYVAEYNNVFPNSNSITCPTISQDRYDKLVVGSDLPESSSLLSPFTIDAILKTSIPFLFLLIISSKINCIIDKWI